MTLQEVAERLGLKDTSALRHAIRRGTLTAERIGQRTFVVSEDEVERYRREHLGQRGPRPKGDATPTTGG